MPTFSDTTDYEFAIQRIIGIPTVCVFEPYNSGFDEGIEQEWLNKARESVIELEGRLQSKQRNFNIDYTIVPPSDQKYYSFANCTIIIKFVNAIPDNPWWLGVARSYSDGSTMIEIRTGQLVYCGYGGTDKYCFESEYQLYNQIAITIKHELVHAVGLGHYSGAGWQVGQPAPSIMVTPHYGLIGDQDITDLDIQTIIQVYGKDGFGTTSYLAPPTLPGSIKIPQDLTTSLQISSPEIYVKYDGTMTTEKMYGKVNSNYFLNGHPLYIKITKPDGTSDTVKVRVSDQRYFEYPLVFDKNSQMGEYYVEIYYLENEGIDKSSFRVTNKKPPVITQAKPEITATLEKKVDPVLKEKALTAKISYEARINDIEMSLNAIGESISSSNYQNSDAQNAINDAKRILDNSTKLLDTAKVKLNAGIYEIEKNNPSTAISFFEKIDSDVDLLHKNIFSIKKLIEKSVELETEQSTRVDANTSKTCFLFWCW